MRFTITRAGCRQQHQWPCTLPTHHVHELVQHGQVAVRARTVLVQTDPATGRSTPLPASVRAALEGVVVPEQEQEQEPESEPEPDSVTVRA